MNRDEFITKQIKKFGCFNANNMEIWMKDYQSVLTEPYIDYVKLDRKIITEWNNTFNAPPTKWINEQKHNCFYENVKNKDQAVINAQEILKTSSPPPEEWADFRAKLKAKSISNKLATLGIA